ncbi:MAG: hypothetical protein ACRDYA_07890 [Egibacteraceae bacterium]
MRGEQQPQAPDPRRLLAVVVQWTGKEVRALRVVLRMPLEGFARLIGAGRSTVTDLERGGAEIVPSWGVQHALDEVLAQASDEAKKRFEMRCEGKSNVWVSDSVGHNGNGGPTNRGDFFKAIGAVLAAGAVPPLEALERIAADVGRSGRVDAGLVAAHEEWADVLAGAHDAQRNDVLVLPVADQADVLFGLLDRPIAPEDRRRLESITVASHVQAGLLAFNAGDRTAARRYFATSWSVADDAGDDTLRARTLGVAQVVHSPIVSGGRGGDVDRAVTLVRRAVHHARRADPVTRATVHHRLGLLLAASGDECGFLAAYEAGDRIAVPYGQPDGHGYLARSFAQPPERATNKGIGLVRVGRAEEAVEALRPTLDPAAPGWTAIVLADIAMARVLQGDPEQACQQLQRALTLARRAGSAMGVERILGVRDQFPEPWAALACVRELDDRLRRPA